MHAQLAAGTLDVLYKRVRAKEEGPIEPSGPPHPPSRSRRRSRPRSCQRSPLPPMAARLAPS
eukprot:2127562-Alexandrium_andersonii.AAC.1